MAKKKDIPTIADISNPSPFIKEQLDALAAASAAGAAAGASAAASPSKTGVATGSSGGKTTPRVVAKTTGRVGARPVDLKPLIDQLNEVKQTQEEERVKQQKKVEAKKAKGDLEKEHEELIEEEEILRNELSDLNKTLSKSLLFKSGAKKAFEGITNFIEHQLPGLAPIFGGIRSVFNTVKGIKDWWQDRQEKKIRKETIKERLKELDLLKKENKLRETGISKEQASKLVRGFTGAAAEGGSSVSTTRDRLDEITDLVELWYIFKGGKGRGKGKVAGKMMPWLGKLFGAGAKVTPGAAAAGGLAINTEKVFGGAAKVGGLAINTEKVFKTAEGAAVSGGLLKGLSKTVGKSAIGKVAGKLLPPLAVGFGLFEGINRFRQGDYLGGIMSLASGFATLIPGWGIPISIGIDLLDWLRQWLFGGSVPTGGKATTSAGNTTPQISAEEQARTTAEYEKKSGATQRANLSKVSSIFSEEGFSPAQTRGMVSEIGRETGFHSQHMYGTHIDAANKKVNQGIISFQGSRRTAMLNFLRDYQEKNPSLKVIDSKGNIIPGDDAIRAQAKFIKYEMSTTSAGRSFLSNRNISPEEAEQVLAKYIGWRINDPKYRDRGIAASRAWGSMHDKLIGGSKGTSQPTNTTPAEQSEFNKNINNDWWGPSSGAQPNAIKTGESVRGATESSQRSSKISAAESQSPVTINNLQAAAQPIKPPMPIPPRRADREAYELLTIAAKIGTVGLLQV